MRVILRELAHTQQAVQHAGLFVTVHDAKLEIPLLQFTIAAQMRIVNEHVRNAVHGLDAVHVAFDLREIHVFTVVGVMPGLFPQLAAQNLRALHKLITALDVFAAQEIFKDRTEQHPLGQPEDHTGGHILMEREQIEFLTELTVVAALGLFDTVQIFLEIFGIGKGRCVDAGKHTVLFVAAPVRPGNGQQLERLHEPGIRNVRPTAQVNEIAVPVQGDGPVFEALDQLDLVGLAHIVEQLDGVGLGNVHPLERNRGINDALHFRFDGFELIGRKRRFHVEIVVEAVFDGGADGHLGGGGELLDGRSHDVRGGMADEAQPFGGVGSNRSQGESLGSSGDRRSQIQKRIAGLAGNRRLEAFSAQSLFQSIRTGRPVGDLNHFSFY